MIENARTVPLRQAGHGSRPDLSGPRSANRL
jgi:hypothetical protein